MQRLRGRTYRDLPGEVQADARLLEAFGEGLRVTVQQAAKDRNLAIGEAVLRTFFTRADGTLAPGLLYLRRRGRHASFQALRARPDLPVSFSHLHCCVRVLIQQSELPADAAEGLGFSHLRALLSLPRGRSKSALASRALRERWSEQTLRAAIAKVKRTLHIERTGGRRPIPEGVKVARACEELAARLAHLTLEDDPELSADQHARLVSALEALRRRLADLAPHPHKHLSFRTLSLTALSRDIDPPVVALIRLLNVGRARGRGNRMWSGARRRDAARPAPSNGASPVLGEAPSAGRSGGVGGCQTCQLPVLVSVLGGAGEGTVD